MLNSISIRAPARGATRLPKEAFELWNISIRAPARGATYEAAQRTKAEANFNSRPCARGDGCGVGDNAENRQISIRAPARGATLQHTHLFLKFLISIRAPARGATATVHKSAPLIMCKKPKHNL